MACFFFVLFFFFVPSVLSWRVLLVQWSDARFFIGRLRVQTLGVRNTIERHRSLTLFPLGVTGWRHFSVGVLGAAEPPPQWPSTLKCADDSLERSPAVLGSLLGYGTSWSNRGCNVFLGSIAHEDNLQKKQGESQTIQVGKHIEL